MFFAPKLAAHFHELYQNWNLVVGIAPVRIINGEAPEWVRRMVLEWARLHQDELLTNWSRCGTARGPLAIAPLT